MKKEKRVCRKVINTETGQVYKSISQASRETGYNYSSLNGWINGKCYNPTSLEYKTNPPPRKDKCAREIIDTSTGKIYSSIIVVSRETGINKGTLAGWISGRTFNKSTFEYLHNPPEPKSKGHRNIIDTSTGKIYHTISEIAELYGVKYGTMLSWINGNIYNPTTFEYETNPPPRKPKSTNSVIDVSTGRIYQSVRECSRELNISYDKLMNWLRGRTSNKSTLMYYTEK